MTVITDNVYQCILVYYWKTCLRTIVDGIRSTAYMQPSPFIRLIVDKICIEYAIVKIA